MEAPLNIVKPALVPPRVRGVGRETTTGAMQPIERNEALPSSKAESVLAAASRTFLAGGFGAVSMDTIAREAGVSKATVYAHFTSKEELFGAMVGRVCGRHFETFSARELDPRDVRPSLMTLGRRFLELVLSPDAIAVHRIIVAEVTRFPALGEVFWRAGPERTLRQIEAFMRSAAAAGSLEIADMRLAAEQFVGLMRGENHLRHLLRLEAVSGEAGIREAVEGAVATFMRAFERRNAPSTT
jgi:TetR/AcrR family transcriptional regulator, mexJK operon transcriptional repressor